MQFINQNPAIGSFQTGVRLGNEERAAADTELRTRMDFENKLMADKAMREGITDYYAQKPPVAAAPAAAPVTPAPRYNTAIPMGPTFEDPAGYVVAPPAPATAAPATATAAPPAAQPPRAAPQRSSFAPIMNRLAGAPGSGGAMMNLFSADLKNQSSMAEQDRKIKAEGAVEAFKALKEGNTRLARTISQHFQLGIPDEAWGDKDFNTAMLKGAGIAKAYGLKDELGADFLRGYVEAYSKASSQNLDPQQVDQIAMQAAVRAVPQGSFKVKSYLPNAKGEITAFGERVGQVQGTGVQHHPTAAEIRIDTGGGGRPSATIQNRNDAEVRLKKAFPGLDDQTANKLVMMGARGFMGPADYARIENNLAKLTDRSGKPVYKTPEERKAAAQALVKDAREATGVLMRESPEDRAPAAAATAGPNIRPAQVQPAAGNDLPAGAKQVGTYQGKPVYSWTDAQGKSHRAVQE